MQDFIHFVGRFHVLALHLPIGILVVAVILDWVARVERYRALARRAVPLDSHCAQRAAHRGARLHALLGGRLHG